MDVHNSNAHVQNIRSIIASAIESGIVQGPNASAIVMAIEQESMDTDVSPVESLAIHVAMRVSQAEADGSSPPYGCNKLSTAPARRATIEKPWATRSAASACATSPTGESGDCRAVTYSVLSVSVSGSSTSPSLVPLVAEMSVSDAWSGRGVISMHFSSRGSTSIMRKNMSGIPDTATHIKATDHICA